MTVCPEGYFGGHCMDTCKCKSEGFICHPATGCVCRQGHEGENCERKISEALGSGETRGDKHVFCDLQSYDKVIKQIIIL